MRGWLAIIVFASAGAAHAAPARPARMPLASRFDLSRFMVHPIAEQRGHLGASRWLAAEIVPPPGPPRDPPLVRIRGKKVKFRMSF